MALIFSNTDKQGSANLVSSGYGGGQTGPGSFSFAPTAPQPFRPERAPISPNYSPAPDYKAPYSPSQSWNPPSAPSTSRSTRRSSGGSGSGDSSSTSTTSWTPSGAAPTMAAGTFNAPKFDEKRITSLAQRFQAPAVRRLRTEVRRAQGEAYDNPNAKRMVLRDALAGYGQGLENVAAGAYKSAIGQYNTEYGHAYNAAMTNFNSQENARRGSFDAALRAWEKSGTTTTTSSTSSGSGGGAGGGSGGYNTPSGGIGYYGTDGQWHEGMPSMTTRRGL